jgi:ribosomal protein S3AE
MPPAASIAVAHAATRPRGEVSAILYFREVDVNLWDIFDSGRSEHRKIEFNITKQMRSIDFESANSVVN